MDGCSVILKERAEVGAVCDGRPIFVTVLFATVKERHEVGSQGLKPTVADLCKEGRRSAVRRFRASSCVIRPGRGGAKVKLEVVGRNVGRQNVHTCQLLSAPDVSRILRFS